MKTSVRSRVIGASLLLASTLLALVLAELGFRIIDGYALDQLPLIIRVQQSTSDAARVLAYARQRTFEPGFDLRWFMDNPPELKGTAHYPLPQDWIDAVKNYRRTPGERAFIAGELKLLYNENWLKEACRTGKHSNVLRHYSGDNPGFVYGFPGPDDSVEPSYRIAPGVWSSNGGDYYNNFGFRGRDLPARKPDRVIRLAFLGASTTQNGWPFPYAEYVANFLRLWARDNNLNVGFDVINAGRGGTNSPFIAAIMKYEVAPLRPDIVVYYEGANDLHTDPIVKLANGKVAGEANPQVARPFMKRAYLPFEDYSALLARIYELLYRRGGEQGEPPKPKHTLLFNLKQTDPDLAQQGLPFHLNRQISDLRRMATAAHDVGAQFFLTSFITLVKDGLRMDPEKHRLVWAGLNQEYAPLTYAEIRDAVDFQNAVYRKLAKTEGWPFLEVDRYFPQDPDLFGDMVHFVGDSNAFRLQGWIMAQLLAPYIRRAIADGRLPRKGEDPDPKAIAWASAPPVKFDLSCLTDK